MKKQLFTLFFSIIFLIPAFAQIKAVTEKGDTIFVYNDGTWAFDDDEESLVKEEFNFLDEVLLIDTLSTKFTVNKKTNKEISTKYDFFKIKYDKDKWKRVPPGGLNAEAEFAFLGVDKDIYCIVISEEIEVGQENLVKIARNMMAENTGSQIKVLKTELRNVNGTDIIRAVSRVNLNGLNLTFDTYNYSGSNGSVQFSTWTSTNLHEKYESEILDFLNGIFITKN